MEMPRRCSSSRRSVSVPVMYRTSVVLPWSTCPAVPMVSAIGRSSKRDLHGMKNRLLVPVQERPNVEPQPLLAHTTHYRRVRRAQLVGYSVGFLGSASQAHGVGRYLVEGERAAAAPAHRGHYIYHQ